MSNEGVERTGDEALPVLSGCLDVAPPTFWHHILERRRPDPASGRRAGGSSSPVPRPLKGPRHSASRDGFSLHGGVRVHANDRPGLERLCRYVLSLPFALHRLSLTRDRTRN